MDKLNFKLNLREDTNQQKNLSSDPVCPYGKCNGYGNISVEGKDDYSSVITCQCIKDKTKLRYLGERFYKVQLAEIEPRTEKQKKLKEVLMQKPETSVFLYGKGGTGKTHFLAAMYNYWESKNKRMKYLEDSTLKDELRNAELTNDFTFVYDLVKDHTHIFLDDVGKAAMTPFHQSALYRFFNEAYKQNRYLFITANDTLNLLGSDQYWGPHATRRVEDLCQLVEF